MTSSYRGIYQFTQGINNHVIYSTSIYNFFLQKSYCSTVNPKSSVQEQMHKKLIIFLKYIIYLILFTIKPRMNREICIKIQRDEYGFNNGLLFFSSLGVFDFSQWIFVFCYLIISASSFRVDKKSWKHKSVNLTH